MVLLGVLGTSKWGGGNRITDSRDKTRGACNVAFRGQRRDRAFGQAPMICRVVKQDVTTDIEVLCRMYQICLAKSEMKVSQAAYRVVQLNLTPEIELHVFFVV